MSLEEFYIYKTKSHPETTSKTRFATLKKDKNAVTLSEPALSADEGKCGIIFQTPE
jgi:hypothetical protein